jgi:hypothetical protein
LTRACAVQIQASLERLAAGQRKQDVQPLRGGLAQPIGGLATPVPARFRSLPRRPGLDARPNASHPAVAGIHRLIE